VNQVAPQPSAASPTVIHDDDSEVPRQPTKHTPEEWDARCQLAVGYRLSHLMGWDLAIYNHITLKVPGSDDIPGGPHFLINPFGLGFEEVTASSLLKVDLEGNVIDKGNSTGILFKNGFVVHSTIHLARPDLHAALHSHQEDIVAVSMTKEGLMPLCQEALGLWGDLRYHKFEGAATDAEERPRMAASLGPTSRNLLLENHGPLCCGATLGECFAAMFSLQRACTYQIKALSLVGGDLSRLHLPSDEEAKALQMREVPTSQDNMANVSMGPRVMWARWVRMIERRDGPENIYV